MRDLDDPGPDLDLLCQAIDLVTRHGYAHAGLLKRRLRVGFAKAGQLLGWMQDYAVIGPHVGTGKARDVLIAPPELPGVLAEIRKRVAANREAKNHAVNSAPADEVYYLETLQFHNGGLFDAEPTDDLVHLVRGTRRGMPGPTLCDIDRFTPGTPGWDLGGGVSGPRHVHKPCPGCVKTAREQYPGLPIAGMRPLSEPVAKTLGVSNYWHADTVPDPAVAGGETDVW